MLRMRHPQPQPQLLARDVRVDRRRRDVGVAEQQLDRAQVRTVVQQLRRERMSQRVRRQWFSRLGELSRRYPLHASRKKHLAGSPLSACPSHLILVGPE